jgi:hypothetical protein
MKFHHTPGPWNYKIQGFQISIGTHDSGATIKGHDYTVAAINDNSHQAEANAKVLAQAPVLLESCIELLGFIERNFPNEDGEAIIDARAAIQSALSE